MGAAAADDPARRETIVVIGPAPPSRAGLRVLPGLALAMRDPSAAARRLSAWCDARSSEFSSILSDDAVALDDFADGDADMADWLVVMARKRPYPLAVQLGLAAVVAGHRISLRRLDLLRDPIAQSETHDELGDLRAIPDLNRACLAERPLQGRHASLPSPQVPAGDRRRATLRRG